MGIFSEDKPMKDPITMTESEMKDQTVHETYPQNIWLKFLIRRLEVLIYYSNEQVSMTAFPVERFARYFLCNFSF